MENYFKNLLNHNEVFSRRLAIVWLMSNRKSLDWDNTLKSIIAVDSEKEYYIMMAVAWALSVFYIDSPSILPRFGQVSKATQRKAIQKIKESKRYNGESLEIV